MKKYYLIPMTEKDIYLNNKSLGSILASSCPELSQMESERVDILYSVSPKLKMPINVEQKYKQHIIKTKKMYDESLVPYYLIAYGDGKCVKELVTETEITSEYPAALEVRSVSKEEVKEYYTSSNYEAKICKFFNKDSKMDKNLFNYVDTDENDNYEIEGYIDGIIENHDVKGNFIGRVKIKKLIKK